MPTSQGQESLTMVLYIIGAIVFVVVTRWIFSIGTLVKNSKKQTALLKKIAEKQGVSRDELDGIDNVYN